MNDTTAATEAQISYLRDLQDRYSYMLGWTLSDDDMDRIRDDARLLRASHADPAIQARIDKLLADPQLNGENRKSFLRAAHEELVGLYVAAAQAFNARRDAALTADPATLTKAEASALIDTLAIR